MPRKIRAFFAQLCCSANKTVVGASVNAGSTSKPRVARCETADGDQLRPLALDVSTAVVRFDRGRRNITNGGSDLADKHSSNLVSKPDSPDANKEVDSSALPSSSVVDSCDGEIHKSVVELSLLKVNIRHLQFFSC